MTDSKLVYSTDPKLNQKCSRCKELQSACRCGPTIELKSFNFVAVLRIEKSGRNGKTVTVIDGIPKVNLYVKELTKKLKNRCGSGGTFDLTGRDAKIEIQGDKRELVRSLLESEGIRVKG
jgi:translation initiation factor 1